MNVTQEKENKGRGERKQEGGRGEKMDEATSGRGRVNGRKGVLRREEK